MGNVLQGCGASSVALCDAVCNEDAEVIKSILERHPEHISWRRFSDGASLLHLAAASGQLAAVEALVRIAQRKAAKCNARKALAVMHGLLDHKNIYDQTALMLACRAGQPAVVRFLLDSGADPLLFDSLHSKTCLHYAVMAGRAECVEALLCDSSVIRTHEGDFKRLRDTFIMDSQGYHRYVDVRSIYAFSPLHLAAGLEHLEAATALIKYGASVSARCTGVMAFSLSPRRQPWKPFATPLHIAVARGHLELVKVILESLALGLAVASHDARRLPDFAGQRPTDIAAHNGQPHLAALLDPALPLRVVWARLNPAAAPPHKGPPALAALAARALRRELYQALLDLHEEACQRRAAAKGGVDAPAPGKALPHFEKAAAQATGEPVVCDLIAPSPDDAPPHAPGSPAPRRWRLRHLRRSASAASAGQFAADSDDWDVCTIESIDSWQVRTEVGRWTSRASSTTASRPDSVAGSGSSANNTDHGGALYAEMMAQRGAPLPERRGRRGQRRSHEGAEAGARRRSRSSNLSSNSAAAVEAPPASPQQECTICCDAAVSVRTAACGHCLCTQCALHVVDVQLASPPQCPFCRTTIGGFDLLPQQVA